MTPSITERLARILGRILSLGGMTYVTIASSFAVAQDVPPTSQTLDSPTLAMPPLTADLVQSLGLESAEPGVFVDDDTGRWLAVCVDECEPGDTDATIVRLFQVQPWDSTPRPASPPKWMRDAGGFSKPILPLLFT